ncbi:unnamed protein product [Bemisia tabaci]|uniref:Uncharacterized protein n=1 Tax=Bemisia tabaci TaxID=7038 RepID=A0A9P0A2U7_BEMTA|nr:unnamed protein product [Bemisia tabaci]
MSDSSETGGKGQRGDQKEMEYSTERIRALRPNYLGKPENFDPKYRVKAKAKARAAVKQATKPANGTSAIPVLSGPSSPNVSPPRYMHRNIVCDESEICVLCFLVKRGIVFLPDIPCVCKLSVPKEILEVDDRKQNESLDSREAHTLSEVVNKPAPKDVFKSELSTVPKTSGASLTRQEYQQLIMSEKMMSVNGCDGIRDTQQHILEAFSRFPLSKHQTNDQKGSCSFEMSDKEKHSQSGRDGKPSKKRLIRNATRLAEYNANKAQGSWADETETAQKTVAAKQQLTGSRGRKPPLPNYGKPVTSTDRAYSKAVVKGKPRGTPIYSGPLRGSHPVRRTLCENGDFANLPRVSRAMWEYLLTVETTLSRAMPFCMFQHAIYELFWARLLMYAQRIVKKETVIRIRDQDQLESRLRHLSPYRPEASDRVTLHITIVTSVTQHHW